MCTGLAVSCCAQPAGRRPVPLMATHTWLMRVLLLASAPLSLVVGAPHGLPGASTCGNQVFNNTLGYLSPHAVREVSAVDAAGCCAACVAWRTCSSWSMQHEWTPKTPCHLSPYSFLRTERSHRGDSCGVARSGPPAPPAPPSPPPLPPFINHGVYIVDTSVGGRRQVVEGVQVELQSDSIGTYNQGMPGGGTIVPDDSPTAIGCPHDLTSSERVRFATQAVRGARTIRLAMGLFLRGLGPDNRSIVGRWPAQMAELKQLQDLSGIEGWAPEYWSPPSGWKSSRSYYSGTLASFDAKFLDEFGDGVCRDIEYHLRVIVVTIRTTA